MRRSTWFARTTWFSKKGLLGVFLLTSCGDGGLGMDTITRVIVSPEEWSFSQPGDTIRFEATFLDAANNPIDRSVPISWTSTNSSVVTVDSNGLATALSNGTGRIRVTAEQVTGEADFAVNFESPFLPEGFEDAFAQLVYNQPLSVVGGGEDFTWSVVGSGLPPGMTITPDGQLNGIPTSTGLFFFTIQADGVSGSVEGRVGLRVCPAPFDLDVGEDVEIDLTSTGGCGFFLPSDLPTRTYRIGVARTEVTTDPGPLRTVLVGVFPRLFSSQMPVPELETPFTRGQAETLMNVPGSASLIEAMEVADQTEAFHNRLREQEREMLEGLSEIRLATPPQGALLQAGTDAAPARRDFVKFTGLCNADPELAPGLLIAEDANVAIYQDSVQSIQFPVTAAHAQPVLDYYTNYGKSVIDSYFGGTSDLNGDGQVTVLVSPVVSGGVAGFVWSGDLLQTSSCGSSNEMDLIYMGRSLITGPLATGNFQVFGTMVHEAKHISSLTQRIISAQTADIPSDFHPTWVEEGAAELAAEMSSRVAWAANGGPQPGETLTGDAFLNSPGFTAENFGVALRLIRMINYLSSQPNSFTNTPIGAPSAHDLRGASWFFHRFLGDAFGGAGDTPLGDAQLFATLNMAATPSGFEGIEAVTGQSMEELIPQFMRAIMANGLTFNATGRAFTTYDFVSAAEVFNSPDPVGLFPWAVTNPGFFSRTAQFFRSDFSGPVGPTGIRIHNFRTVGNELGAEFRVSMDAPGKVIVMRIQ